MRAGIRVRHLQAERCPSLRQSPGSWVSSVGPLPLAALTGREPCHHHGLGLPASGTLREDISVVEATRSVVLCFDSPRKQNKNLVRRPPNGGHDVFVRGEGTAQWLTCG